MNGGARWLRTLIAAAVVLSATALSAPTAAYATTCIRAPEPLLRWDDRDSFRALVVGQGLGVRVIEKNGVQVYTQVLGYIAGAEEPIQVTWLGTGADGRRLAAIRVPGFPGRSSRIGQALLVPYPGGPSRLVSRIHEPCVPPRRELLGGKRRSFMAELGRPEIAARLAAIQSSEPFRIPLFRVPVHGFGEPPWAWWVGAALLFGGSLGRLATSGRRTQTRDP